MKDVLTKGDVIVNKLKADDVHYEFQWGYVTVMRVISEPVRHDNGMWTWIAANVLTGENHTYSVDEANSAYAPALYTYEAYANCKQV